MIEVRADWQTPNSWPTCYENGVILNKDRNMHIVNEAMALPTPCLIMVDQIGHGELIQKLMLKHMMRDVPFVRGDTSKDERLEWIKKCKEGKVPYMIASTIFDEGLDIPNLRSLILAGGKKSEIRSIQRLGRGLRRADNKTAVEVIDFYDLNPKILEKHSKERLGTWEDEGYTVTIEKIK
jgi:superfamily II DNA or RNA helicase